MSISTDNSAGHSVDDWVRKESNGSIKRSFDHQSNPRRMLRMLHAADRLLTVTRQGLLQLPANPHPLHTQHSALTLRTL
jgi:hypothetical protein